MTRAMMIAATGSGAGKTTVVCALLAALKNRGLRTRAFKCGPDYIDPMFHREVVGVPSRNLDLVMSDAETTREIFLRDALSADALVVEGVMGLYDGLDFRSDVGSSAALARTLGLPVTLVVDARGMGRSVLALVKGFLEMDAGNSVVGVLLNRVSKGTFERMKPLIEDETRARVFGYFPEDKSGGLESRYLGLKLPHEVADLRAKANRAAETLEETVDLDALLQLAREITPPSAPADSDDSRAHFADGPATRSAKVARIAVARDDAFCFYYEDNLRMLRDAGAELVFYSPLQSPEFPDDVDGLLLGGGYPELYAERLSGNRALLESTRRAIAAGLPTVAECGGFLYLHDALVAEDGARYPMVGVVPGECRNMGKLVRFGYVEIEEREPRFWQSAASRKIRGHEFHYFDSSANGDDCSVVKLSSKRSGRFGYADESRFLGFPHLYYPSNPEFPKVFVEKCARWRNGKF